jgi:pimeloyl-ACP methyl ester carboxylesterase
VSPRPARAGIALVAVAVLVGASALPPVRARVRAAGVVADVLGLPLPRLPGPAVGRHEVRLGGVAGHLYGPGGPGILFVPGATPLGREDPRAVALARALARAHRSVFVPELLLYEQRFDPEDLDRLVRASRALADRTGEQVTMLGVSYGGSFALIAAADPRLRGRLALVAVFGAYFDLGGVLQAVTTGVTEVEGARFPWVTHPQAERILREQVVELVPEADRPALEEALAGGGTGEALRPGPRAVLDLLANRDPARTAELIWRLPSDLRGLLRRFSPSAVAARLEAPVVAMHSIDDPAVPYGEAIRLVRGVPGARLVSVRGFRHVDPTSGGGLVRAAADLLALWRFGGWLLASQE